MMPFTYHIPGSNVRFIISFASNLWPAVCRDDPRCPHETDEMKMENKQNKINYIDSVSWAQVIQKSSHLKWNDPSTIWLHDDVLQINIDI